MFIIKSYERRIKMKFRLYIEFELSKKRLIQLAIIIAIKAIVELIS